MYQPGQGQLSPAAPSQWPTYTAAKDQHTGLAYACYFMLGSGILAPWNAFITAADYFEAVFPGRHMDRLFTVAYLPICLIFLGVMIKYNAAPVRPRILTSFAGFVLIMLAVPLVDVVLVGEAGAGPDSALAVILLAVIIVGVLDGLSQGAIFGDAAVLPPRYTHAVVGGTASSGVIICLLRVLTKAALPATRAGLRKSTSLYFGISGAICLACWGIYYAVLPRLGVVRHYKQINAAGGGSLELSPPSSVHLDSDQTQQPVFTLGGEDDEHPLMKRSTDLMSDQPEHVNSSGHRCHTSHTLHYVNGISSRGHSPRQAHSSIHHQHIDSSLLSREHNTVQAGSGQAAGKQLGRRLPWQHVVAEAWHSALAMFLVYTITLSIFPGVLAEDTKSEKLGSWYPIILITIFNVSDLIGKNIPLCGLAPRPSRLLLLSLLRLLFIPAFFFVGKYAADAAMVMGALTITLGFTNGLLTALLMTLAPASVETQEAGLVENVMVFSLVAGLTVGAVAGWLWLL